MKEITRKVYYCDHCKKKSFRRSVIEKHEPLCWGNPLNFPACGDCIHMDKQTRDAMRVLPNGDTVDTQSGPPYPYCKKYRKQLHTQGAIAKGLLNRYPEQFEGSELMPKFCEGQEIWPRQTADTFLP